jgi:small subunit ribosomal protein S8
MCQARQVRKLHLNLPPTSNACSSTDSAGFSVEPGRVGEVIRVRLRYSEKRDPVISGMERVSRPGRRRYVPKDNVPRIFGGMGTTIMSTSRGVMTGHEARQRGVGGEVVAHIW